MKGVLVVAAREIAERKRIFLAAAVASLLPFLTPLLPDVARGNAAEVRGFFALLFLAAFGIGTAAVLGSAVLARDLAERRAGFFFSRPLAPLSIWGGKMLGVFLLALGAALLCAVPTLLASPATGLLDPSLAPTGTWNLAGLYVGGLLFLVAFSHACAVALRSRSPWLAVDVVLLVVCAFAIAASLFRLDRAGYQIQGLASGVAAFAALPILLAAGAVSTAAGRTDLKRVHRVQSLVIWGTLVPLALAGSAYAHWLLTPTLSDLTAIYDGAVSPRGDWLMVVGRARGRGWTPVAFLMKGDSSAGLRIPRPSFWAGAGDVFSPDGRIAYGLVRESQKPELWRLWRVDLDAARPEIVPTGITSSHLPAARISPSGRLVGLLAAQTLSVVDLTSEKTLSAVRLDDEFWNLSFFFSDDETIRILRSTRPGRDKSTEPLPLLEFRIREKRVQEAGAAPRLDLSVPPTPGDRDAPKTKGLRPLGPRSPFFGQAYPSPAGREEPQTKYFLDESGALVRFDVSTGERKQILPKSK